MDVKADIVKHPSITTPKNFCDILSGAIHPHCWSAVDGLQVIMNQVFGP
jgi:hypothetical protein